MDINKLIEWLKTADNAQLSWMLDDVANSDGVGSFAYCTVKAEIFRRLNEKWKEDKNHD